MTKTTILINKKPYHFETETLKPIDFINAVDAPSDYEVWLIVKDADPEGQLPNNDVQITSETHIESGQRYRVVPPGTFGGLR